MMYFYEKNIVIPLYIGKSEKYGKQGNNLSSNIENISKNKHRFCRWGDNYAYHIGDLSAVVCPNHPETKIQRKYKKWAKKIFENYPTYEPKLKKPVYFWIMAWQKGNMGIFQDFGETPLTALEYQLISVASTVFPNDLLNYEGVNRGQEYIWFLLIQIYSEIINQKILTL